MHNTLPQNPTNNRAILAVGLTCLLGWLFAYLSIYVFKDYAFGLFVWLPLVMGVSSTVLYGYKNPTAKRELRNISFLSLFIFCTGLLFMALEGIICLVMAAPIGLFFNWAGYEMGRIILGAGQSVKPPTLLLLFILSVPAWFAWLLGLAKRPVPVDQTGKRKHPAGRNHLVYQPNKARPILDALERLYRA